MRRICFLGDSFAHGTGDETGRGWVGRLIEGEATRGCPVVAFNLGLPLEITPHLAERWRGEVERRLIGAEAGDTGLVLAFGLDDMSDMDDLGIRVDLPQSMAIAENLISEASTRHPLLWIGPPPARSKGSLPVGGGHRVRYRKERLGALNLAYRRVAEDLRVPYLDLHGDAAVEAAFRGALGPDGGAHQAVADRVAGWLPWRRWLDPALSNPAKRSPPPSASDFQPLRATGGFLS
jgi:lysophospholipase L1-like esterase